MEVNSIMRINERDKTRRWERESLQFDPKLSKKSGTCGQNEISVTIRSIACLQVEGEVQVQPDVGVGRQDP
jgi:hypothetical protein